MLRASEGNWLRAGEAGSLGTSAEEGLSVKACSDAGDLHSGQAMEATDPALTRPKCRRPWRCLKSAGRWGFGCRGSRQGDSSSRCQLGVGLSKGVGHAQDSMVWAAGGGEGARYP